MMNRATFSWDKMCWIPNLSSKVWLVSALMHKMWNLNFSINLFKWRVCVCVREHSQCTRFCNTFSRTMQSTIFFFFCSLVNGRYEGKHSYAKYFTQKHHTIHKYLYSTMRVVYAIHSRAKWICSSWFVVETSNNNEWVPMLIIFFSWNFVQIEVESYACWFNICAWFHNNLSAMCTKGFK